MKVRKILFIVEILCFYVALINFVLKTCNLKKKKEKKKDLTWKLEKYKYL